MSAVGGVVPSQRGPGRFGAAGTSADLRNYYAKHVKTDRLDSQLLARLPMLHPEGLHLE